MDCSTPGFPVHHQNPELAQTHVHTLIKNNLKKKHDLIEVCYQKEPYCDGKTPSD